jgi:7-cyano-7-deazaguanine synthase
MSERKKLLLHEPGDAADWQGCPDFPTCVTLHRGVQAVEIPKPELGADRAVVLLSGGMDSTTLAYDLDAAGWKLTLVSFNYGQKHGQKELAAARRTAVAIGEFEGEVDHIEVDISELGHSLDSALTDPLVEIPEGHYTDETMSATVVPNRNAILLGIAWGIAESQGATIIATAVHAGDHPIYADCRPEFISALSTAFFMGSKETHVVQHIVAPYAKISKTDIARRGHHLDVIWSDTWSCYKGGDVHCGKCGTCVERIEAFTDAGVTDVTEYEPF